MAYNYYPNYTNYTNPYMGYPQQFPMPQPQPQPQQTQQPQMQIQNGGFVSVRNEQEARNYPVAPGNSVTFKDETAPYVYTKTMGFSQLDRPIFDRYKLVKEDTQDVTDVVAQEVVENVAQQKIQDEITKLWQEINALKDARKPVTKKKEAVNETE